MGQYPDKLPKELRELFDAIGRGDVPPSPDTDLSGDNDFFGKNPDEPLPPPGGDGPPSGITEITGDSSSGDTAETNRLLAEIVRALENLPVAIWDEVEGR